MDEPGSRAGGDGELKVFLAGDVMTGRGIDQILPRPSEPELREPATGDARDYVALAEAASGPIPAPAPPGHIWGYGLDVLGARAPDAGVVNLETSVTTAGAFSPDKQVHYRMNPRNTGVLALPGLDACALANNHILDFGPDGLSDTLAALRAIGVEPVGAGRDLAEARRPAAILSTARSRIWVAAIGSGTSGIPPSWAATADGPGVNRIPDLSEDTARDVAGRLTRRRVGGDVALVSIHWGSNWGFSIDADMQRFARALIDGGVDVVHGHSSHHIRPIEIYKERLILYGAGDLITDYEGIRGYEHYRGEIGAMYFPTLSPRDGALLDLEIVPTRMKGLGLRAPSREDARWLLDTLNRVSAPYGARFIDRAPGDPAGALALADMKA